MEKVNPEHVEMLTQVYEALDTVQEDLAHVREAERELLADDVTAEQKLIVYEAAAQDRALILPRRAYALGSLIGLELSRADVRDARSQYLPSSEEDGRAEAVQRLIEHEARIRYARQTGDATTNKQLHDIETRPERVSTHSVRIIKTRTDSKGQEWVSLCDPSVVEVAPKPGTKRLISEYKVNTIEHDQDTGVVKAQLKTKEGTRTISYTPGRYCPWILSSDGKKMSLVSRPSLHGLLDVDAGTLGDILLFDSIAKVGDEALEVAIDAAGANVPHIISGFEYPDHVNPIPLNVPKTS